MGRVTQPCMLDLDAIYFVALHYGCIVFFVVRAWCDYHGSQQKENCRSFL